MSKSNSFCVPFEKLEPAAIAELHKRHPGALPISTEWRLNGNGDSVGSAVIWWVPSPETDDPDGPDLVFLKRREWGVLMRCLMDSENVQRAQVEGAAWDYGAGSIPHQRQIRRLKMIHGIRMKFKSLRKWARS